MGLRGKLDNLNKNLLQWFSSAGLLFMTYISATGYIASLGLMVLFCSSKPLVSAFAFIAQYLHCLSTRIGVFVRISPLISETNFLPKLCRDRRLFDELIAVEIH